MKRLMLEILLYMKQHLEKYEVLKKLVLKLILKIKKNKFLYNFKKHKYVPPPTPL